MDAWEMADAYTAIDELVKTGTQTTLKAPFMTLSFLALPVIPQLKLTDKGLFDVNTFAYSELFS
jgi:adenine deaminase